MASYRCLGYDLGLDLGYYCTDAKIVFVSAKHAGHMQIAELSGKTPLNELPI